MQHPFTDESPHIGALADLVAQIVDVDARRRALDAHRATLLAQAYTLAEREGLRATGLDTDETTDLLAGRASFVGVEPVGLPRGAGVRRDRAHRMVRAEIASALRVPETHISRDMTHAVDAVERCPHLHRALAEGQVTAQHVHTVVDAGRIISHRAVARVGGTLVDADGAALSEADAGREVARRYALYEAAVLPYALTHTAPLLAPVAKRLAEKVAGVTFDDRHVVARQDRRVWLTELEDGMCNVTAHLTSVEAHAVFDQLTQYGKRLQQADISASGITRTPAPEPGAVAGVGASTVAGARAAFGAAEAMKRPLPEARADSLVTLLLEGQVPDTGELPSRVGPRVTARVQVLVPVSLTGRLDTAPRQTPTNSVRVRGAVGAGGSGGSGAVTGAHGDAAGGTVGAGAHGAAGGGAGGRAGEAGAATVTSSDAGWFQPELVGVGPIDSDTAQRIAHDTPTWDIVIVDDSSSATGAVNAAGPAGSAGPADVVDGACTASTASTADTASTANAAGVPGASGAVGTVGVSGTPAATFDSCPDPGLGSDPVPDPAPGPGLGSGPPPGLDSDPDPGLDSGLDPDTMGDVLSVEGYRVPARLRRLLAARDQRCRFPGCNLPVHRCDIDHTIAAEDGGPTATDNLGHLCRGHHILKHHGSCLVEQGERGVYEWTYPSGRVYREPSPSKVTFTTALGPPELQRTQQQIRARRGRDAPTQRPGTRPETWPEAWPEPPSGPPPEGPPPW